MREDDDREQATTRLLTLMGRRPADLLPRNGPAAAPVMSQQAVPLQAVPQQAVPQRSLPQRAVPRQAVLAAVVLAVAVVVGVVARVVTSGAGGVASQPVRATVAARPAVPATGSSGPGATGVAGSVVATPLMSGASGAQVGVGAGVGAGVEVVVDVVGRVRRPGVVRLPTGSRVGDAVAAAGGATSGAAVQRINLARKLVDGEQIVVPGPGDPVPVAAASGPGAAGGSGGAGSSESAVVDLNTATLAELDALPGVGPVTAGRIIDWRTEHGRFSRVDELGEVPGIGPKSLERLRSRVRV